MQVAQTGKFPKRAVWAILLLLLLHQENRAGAVYDFNLYCQQAYREIIRLKLSTGQQLLEKEKKRHPDNLIPYFLENYIDFFELFFNEDPAEFRKRIRNRAKRLDKLNTGPESSPFYLFTKSIVHFQWAAVQIKFGHNWDAGWEFRRSFLQAKACEKAFPDFYPNQLYASAMQVAAGTIPDGYQWLSNLLSIKGSISKGMAGIRTFMKRTDEWSVVFREEALFYYCYLQYYVENNKAGVFSYLEEFRPDLVNNHLLAYLAANLSLNNQQSERAISIIKARNQSDRYLDMPVWDLELGYALLNRQDDAAAASFEAFLQKFKGRFYVKDVLQKLSWYYYLRGDTRKAAEYRAQLLKKGSLDSEADKQAQKEALSGAWPHPVLLKARLLNDGGYLEQALELLKGKAYTGFEKPADQTEFCYRIGRLYDDMGNADRSIGYYQQAFGLGAGQKEYFAARAAIQLGAIFERKGSHTQAIEWYTRCLQLKEHDYKNALDQKAKAGIARCKGD